MKKLILSLAIFFLITGMVCMTERGYVGDRLPSDQVAVIYGGLVTLRYLSPAPEYMGIESVDGLPIKSSRKYAVEVLPGNHVLKVSRWRELCGWFSCDKDYTQFGTVNFHAEAGKAYKLNSRWKDRILHFWINER